MNKYKLTPIPENLNDQDWEASTHNDSIYVYADNEQDARHICIEATGIAAQISPGERTPEFPWVQERLVTCRKIDENCGKDRSIISPEELRDKWLMRHSSRK